MASEPPDEIRIVAYRIAQEALVNAAKHARASLVRVELSDRDDGYLLRVTDDGVGFAAADLPRSEPGHLGLSAMRERAEMAGGSCDISSLPGAGASVSVWLPGPVRRSADTVAHADVATRPESRRAS
jgi:signal transduction histidine kinase